VYDLIKKELVGLRVDVTSLNKALKAAAIPSGGVAPLAEQTADLEQRHAAIEAALKEHHRSLSQHARMLADVQLGTQRTLRQVCSHRVRNDVTLHEQTLPCTTSHGCYRLCTVSQHSDSGHRPLNVDILSLT
jgi:hypothetical protein